MPVWLRRHIFNLIKEHFEKVKEEELKAVQKAKNIQTVKPPERPAFSPTYTTNTSKK